MSEASERAWFELLCAVVVVVLRGAVAPLRVAVRSRHRVLPCVVNRHRPQRTRIGAFLSILDCLPSVENWLR